MKPILFNSEMVRALSDGRKTVTRRLVRPQPAEREQQPHKLNCGSYCFNMPGAPDTSTVFYRPPYIPGDILYVRETWAKPYGAGYKYAADYREHDIVEADAGYVSVSKNLIKWRPSIHMPKEAARIFLRVKNIRMEQLQQIHAWEMEKEGLRVSWGEGLMGAWKDLWNSSVQKKDLPLFGWDANPWVWVIEFEPAEKPKIKKEIVP